MRGGEIGLGGAEAHVGGGHLGGEGDLGVAQVFLGLGEVGCGGGERRALFAEEIDLPAGVERGACGVGVGHDVRVMHSGARAAAGGVAGERGQERGALDAMVGAGALDLREGCADVGAGAQCVLDELGEHCVVETFPPVHERRGIERSGDRGLGAPLGWDGDRRGGGGRFGAGPSDAGQAGERQPALPGAEEK